MITVPQSAAPEINYPGSRARLLNEARDALPPTIFFFVGINFVVFTTNLLLADYAVAVSSFMLATVAALVVGKAVLVANAMPYLRRYDRAPLIQPILYKTAFYWVVVFFARLIERFVHFSVEGNFVGLTSEFSGQMWRRAIEIAAANPASVGAPRAIAPGGRGSRPPKSH
jgi:hypothetical protein